MIRFASLGSGSRGNSLVVESGGTRVLVDCGFGPRDTAGRLRRLGIEPEQICAVLVTHEHSDHVGGAFKFSATYGAEVLLTHGTRAATRPIHEERARLRVFDSHVAFPVGGLEVQPFPVPHDAREPVQFVLSDGAWRLGVLTDVGCSTAHIERILGGCDALVLECNHDPELLRAGDYPPMLKQRISGRYGHLDNTAAAALLGALDRSRLRHLVAAHLSEQNNRPDLARLALAGAANCEPGWICVATQDEGFGWRELR